MPCMELGSAFLPLMAVLKFGAWNPVIWVCVCLSVKNMEKGDKHLFLRHLPATPFSSLGFSPHLREACSYTGAAAQHTALLEYTQ